MKDRRVNFAIAPRTMSEAEFVACFGGVYEHTPTIAARTWQEELSERHDSVAGLAEALVNTVDNLGQEDLLQLINAHPDLAGRAAIAGALTADSASEQSGAGIDQCSAEEFAQFESFNERYKTKFGFTFIMAVKGSDRHRILENFEQRLGNDAEAEFERALQEIHKIARFRLREIAAQQGVASNQEQGNVG